MTAEVYTASGEPSKGRAGPPGLGPCLYRAGQYAKAAYCENYRFSNQLSQRPSNVPVRRRILDSPKVLWVVKLHSQQPRNTLKKRNGQHNAALLVGTI